MKQLDEMANVVRFSVRTVAVARGAIFALAIFAALVALTGCASNGNVDTSAPPPRSQLPPVPVDIRQCFSAALGTLPDRDMTVAEVEAAWKSDRVRFRMTKSCALRFLAWYDDVRARWQ